MTARRVFGEPQYAFIYAVNASNATIFIRSESLRTLLDQGSRQAELSVGSDYENHVDWRGAETP